MTVVVVDSPPWEENVPVVVRIEGKAKKAWLMRAHRVSPAQHYTSVQAAHANVNFTSDAVGLTFARGKEAMPVNKEGSAYFSSVGSFKIAFQAGLSASRALRAAQKAAVLDIERPVIGSMIKDALLIEEQGRELLRMSFPLFRGEQQSPIDYKDGRDPTTVRYGTGVTGDFSPEQITSNRRRFARYFVGLSAAEATKLATWPRPKFGIDLSGLRNLDTPLIKPETLRFAGYAAGGAVGLSALLGTIAMFRR